MSLDSSLSRTFRELNVKNDEIRILEQEIAYAFYNNWQAYLTELLNADLAVFYDPGSKILKVEKSILNITKKLINSISVTYLEPAQRFVFRNGEVDEDLTEYYNTFVLPSNVNTLDKRANRLFSLQGTSISILGFNAGKQKFTQVINSSHLYDVRTKDDDIHDLSYLAYDYVVNPSCENPIIAKVVWTDEKHYIVNAVNEDMSVGEAETTDNPYGTIPKALFTDSTLDDFWGEPANDVVSTNREINILKAKLLYDDLFLGTSGFLFGTNLGKLTSGNSKDGDNEVQLGRQNIYNAQQSQSGGNLAPPDLKYVSTNPQVASVVSAINEIIRMVALSRGLNPEVFAETVKNNSGFAKIIDRIEQMETRKEDRDIAVNYENERFDKFRIVNNTHYKNNDITDGMEIPEDAELKIDFGETEMPKSVDDQITENDYKIANNLTNYYKIYQSENPDIKNPEQIEKILKENQEINSRLSQNQLTTLLGEQDE